MTAAAQAVDAQPLVTVITAHGGSPLLARCIASVRDQGHGRMQHLVVADGPETWVHARAVIDAVPGARVDLVLLPYAIGKERWNGHRIYAAGTFIAEGEFMLFLDDDNALEPSHVQDCLATCRRGNDWAYALRNIVDAEHAFVCRDDCESLGKWPSVMHAEDFLIDVNCYFLPKMLAVRIAPAWYRKFREPGKPEIDRVLAYALRQIAPNHDCTYRYTVNYRVGNTALSVQPAFFLQGNAEMLRRHGGALPWSR